MEHIKTFEGFREVIDKLTMKEDREELKRMQIMKTKDYEIAKKTVLRFWQNNYPRILTKKEIKEMIDKLRTLDKKVDEILKNEKLYDTLIIDIYDFFIN